MEAKRGLLWLQKSDGSMCGGCTQETGLEGGLSGSNVPDLHSEEGVEAEVELLRSSYQSKETNLDDLIAKYTTFISRRDVWRPLIIMLCLFLLQQFCGLSTITFYAVDVLAASHSSIDKVSAHGIFLLGSRQGWLIFYMLFISSQKVNFQNFEVSISALYIFQEL